MTLLDVQHLTITYPSSQGDVTALGDVSFQINEGERVAIIGRSGSGKTSLLRAISGLLQPAKGTMSFAGAPLDDKRRQQRDFYKQIGLVFQDYGLVKQLTALQNTLCGSLYQYPSAGALMRFESEDIQRATELLTNLGLSERLDLPSAKLSGGEQQRVGIARLLMQSPTLMLLDEPIASLDVHWSHEALEQLKQAPNATSIVILHDLNMVRQWATRALLIHDGELRFDGDPDEACAMLESIDTSPGTSTKTSEHTSTQTPEATAPKPELTPGQYKRGTFYLLTIGALIGLYAWAATGVNVSSSKIFGSAPKALAFVQRLFPPDWSVTQTVGTAILETIQMAIWGTTFAAIFALPLSMMAARNISPVWVRFPTRLLLNLMRTVPSIVWGLFFVAIVGLGPFPGILALTFYATGYLGKFFYEGVESIDPGPLTALRTVGASRMQRFRYGVFPQVLPLFTSYTIYMFEYNVRAASILGIVGAGGIGFYLHAYINNFVYTKATTALILLLALVTCIDAISSKLRERLTL